MKYPKVVRAMSILLGVIYFAATAVGLVCLLLCIFMPGFIIGKVDLADMESSGMHMSGFFITPAGNDISMGALAVFFAACMIVSGLFWMIFRQISQAVRTLDEKARDKHDALILRKSVVRRIKRIGYFAIAIPASEIALTVVGNTILSSSGIIASTDSGSITMGILVFFISRIVAEIVTRASDREQEDVGAIEDKD